MIVSLHLQTVVAEINQAIGAQGRGKRCLFPALYSYTYLLVDGNNLCICTFPFPAFILILIGIMISVLSLSQY